MADDIKITQGSGTTIATDDVSSVHYQKIKIVDGADQGTTGAGVGANGLAVDIKAITPAITIADIQSGTISAKQNGAWIVSDISSGTIVVRDILSGTVNIKDNGGSITVDFASGNSVNVSDIQSGTISAKQNGTWTVVASDIQSGTIVIRDILAGTVNIKDNGGSITVDVGTALPTGANAIGKLAANSGVDIGDVTVDNASGASAVNIQDGGNSITIDGSITVADITTGTVNVRDNGGSISVDDNAGSLTVDFASNPSVNVADITSGTIYIRDIIAGTVNIKDNGGSITVDGSVNIGTFPDNEPFNMAQYGGSATGAANAIHVQPGTGALFVVSDILSGSISIRTGTIKVSDVQSGTIAVQGTIAHDAVDNDKPVKIGGKAYNYDGTVPGTAVAELDRANFITDLYGRQYVETAHPNYWSATEAYTTAQGAGNTLVVNPGAGLKLFLTDLLISNGAAAGTITVVEGLNVGLTTTKAGPFAFAANGGVPMSFRTPIALTANYSLGVVSTDSTNHSITVSGFTSA